ncbi:hypothetical protein LP422_23100 [Janibacter limosus]|uniref:hypothetical protein n=1 Tax=Janibacter limosus TaxID=53458 RepID=UPI0035DB9DCD|nr:hypothetical protein LP422_23100 [Janibacter limosus]
MHERLGRAHVPIGLPRRTPPSKSQLRPRRTPTTRRLPRRDHPIRTITSDPLVTVLDKHRRRASLQRGSRPLRRLQQGHDL